jgi:hypothetical protein
MCLLASPRLYPLFSCLVKAYTQRLTICFYGINMSNIDHILIVLTKNSLSKHLVLSQVTILVLRLMEPFCFRSLSV